MLPVQPPSQNMVSFKIISSSLGLWPGEFLETSQSFRTSALPPLRLTIPLVTFCTLPHVQSSSTGDKLIPK